VHQISKVVAVAVAAVVVAGGFPAGAGPTNKKRARLGISYIQFRQHNDGSVPGFSAIGSTADAILAAAATSRGPRLADRAVAFLDQNEAEIDTVGELGKVVMALAAVGLEPALGGRNLADEIEASQQPSGQYGDPTSFSQVFDHSLAVLGLSAAGRAVPGNAAQWLVDAQCGDGGWQFDGQAGPTDDEHCSGGPEDFTTSDTNTTAYAVMALVAAPGREQLAGDPFAYFRSARDRIKKGWRFSHERRPFGFRAYTDTNSTAIVLQAHAAEGRAVPRKSRRALRRLQYQTCGRRLGGAFAFTWEERNGKLRRSPSKRDARAETRNDGPTVIGATIAAVPGLLKKPFPLDPVELTRKVPRPPRCS
jgi:hypothetical protein